ncbi:MAG: EamA family transporter, partial [Thermosphaera sp.]
LSFGLGMALFIKALSIGGVQVSALPTLIAPVVGRVFSIIVNEEKPDSNGIIGTFVTVLGLSIGFLKTTF